MLCTPEQFKGRIGYFIFVDRFCRGNESPLNPVEGRILKDWEDSVPNWWPNEKGEYPNNYFWSGPSVYKSNLQNSIITPLRCR